MHKDTERAIVEQTVTRKIEPNPQNWWDGFGAGIGVTLFLEFILFVVIMMNITSKG